MRVEKAMLSKSGQVYRGIECKSLFVGHSGKGGKCWNSGSCWDAVFWERYEGTQTA